MSVSQAAVGADLGLGLGLGWGVCFLLSTCSLLHAGCRPKEAQDPRSSCKGPPGPTKPEATQGGVVRVCVWLVVYCACRFELNLKLKHLNTPPICHLYTHTRTGPWPWPVGLGLGLGPPCPCPCPCFLLLASCFLVLGPVAPCPCLCPQPPLHITTHHSTTHHTPPHAPRPRPIASPLHPPSSISHQEPVPNTKTKTPSLSPCPCPLASRSRSSLFRLYDV
jgi:hypothetical protein